MLRVYHLSSQAVDLDWCYNILYSRTLQAYCYTISNKDTLWTKQLKVFLWVNQEGRLISIQLPASWLTPCSFHPFEIPPDQGKVMQSVNINSFLRKDQRTKRNEGKSLWQNLFEVVWGINRPSWQISSRNTWEVINF